MRVHGPAAKCNQRCNWKLKRRFVACDLDVALFCTQTLEIICRILGLVSKINILMISIRFRPDSRLWHFNELFPPYFSLMISLWFPHDLLAISSFPWADANEGHHAEFQFVPWFANGSHCKNRRFISEILKILEHMKIEKAIIGKSYYIHKKIMRKSQAKWIKKIIRKSWENQIILGKSLEHRKNYELQIHFIWFSMIFLWFLFDSWQFSTFRWKLGLFWHMVEHETSNRQKADSCQECKTCWKIWEFTRKSYKTILRKS